MFAREREGPRRLRIVIIMMCERFRTRCCRRLTVTFIVRHQLDGGEFFLYTHTKRRGPKPSPERDAERRTARAVGTAARAAG